MTEEWRDFASGEEGYQVSNFGNLRSFWHRKSLGVGKGTTSFVGDNPISIASISDKKGYHYVVIKGGHRKPKRYAVARLVLEAFVGIAPDGYESCHFPDVDPSNNRLDNLRWDTHQENQRDVARLGRIRNVKLDPEKIRVIRSRYANGEFQKVIAADFGIYQADVSSIVLKKSWGWVD